MTTTSDAVVASVVTALNGIDDPGERLEEMQVIRGKLDEALKGVRQRIAVELHASGKTWRQVGDIMGGLSAQRAWQISRGE